MLNNKTKFESIYGNNKEVLTYQRQRYARLISKYHNLFKEEPTHYFSSPGRTELSGNHTDHNHGFVLAASINLDSVACVAKEDSMIKIFSEGYKKPFVINLGNLKKLKKEAGTTNSLIRGIASGFKEKGYNIGGFNAVIGSDVLQGSGLSSSASIEILIGTIFNTLYNNGKILPEEIAKIGQDAENIYFEKSCGLMDQMACAVGGIISIDFYDPLKPKIKKINFDFTRQKYSLVFVHTGGSHISLTKDYEAIPNEMKEVAVQFGKKYCSEIDFKDFFHRIKKLRKKISDRAILRCYHFFKENERVKNQIKALQKNDFNNFLFFVNDSGNSSYKYLQNIYSSVDPHFQPISIALAFTENFINKIGKGACRIHGGGFEGTIQVLIDNKYVDQFIKYVSNISDNFKVLNLNIREFGSTEVIMK